jgi:hypothetical protein
MFEHFKNFKKIVVTGPQRSGTRIAAKMISFDLGYEMVDESMFGTHYDQQFRNILRNRKNIVVHAPAMSHIAHTLDDDVAVVFMIRVKEDIIQSEKRIRWPDSENDREIEKYCDLKSYYDNKLEKSCDVKVSVWTNYQKKLIKHSYEVFFDSLKGHPLYKRKKDRIDFRWNQT